MSFDLLSPTLTARILFCGAVFGISLIPSARAQESLGGVGASIAGGATLGAAAGTGLTAGGATRGRGGAAGFDETDADLTGGTVVSDTTTTTTTTTVTTGNAPILQTFGLDSRRAVQQLLRPEPTRPQPTRVRRSPRGQARYVRATARQAPQTRTKVVTRKYRVPSIGWRGAYLPQDRYKFGKVWRYVSTEDAGVYFRPQDMARRRFNPNRVIGFRTWQDAMLAGYRPDPSSRPEPGAQIADLARLTRRQNLYRFVDYVYSGQVSPERFTATYNYARQVATSLNRTAYARPYISGTVDRVLQAAVEGNPNLIPRSVGGTRVAAAAPATATPGMGQSPTLPNAPTAPTAAP